MVGFREMGSDPDPRADIWSPTPASEGYVTASESPVHVAAPSPTRVNALDDHIMGNTDEARLADAAQPKESPGLGSPEERDDPPEHTVEYRRPMYRKATAMPQALKDYCRIDLEEGLYLPAIRLLDSLLTDGSVHTPPREAALPRPARLPPPPELALLGTLVVHPAFTSHPADLDRIEVATMSLAYLRAVLRLVGPVNANLREAFRFRAPATAGGGGGGGGGKPRAKPKRRLRNGDGLYADVDADADADADQDECGRMAKNSHDNNKDRDGGTPNYDSDDNDFGQLDSRFWRSQTVWVRAPDFWSVVAWAFRCAAVHPHRWTFWNIWLGFMLDVLEADWEDRLAMDEEALATQERVRATQEQAEKAQREAEGKKAPASKKKEDTGRRQDRTTRYRCLCQSLLVSYLDDLRRERKNLLAETMRAIFAFVDKKHSVAEKTIYRQVFEEGLAGLEKGKKWKPGAGLDQPYGGAGDDYDDLGDDFTNNPPVTGLEGTSPPKGTPKPMSPSDEVSDWEGDEEDDYWEDDRPRRGPLGRTTSTGHGRTAPDSGRLGRIAETIPLRMRLFRLLSAVAHYLEEDQSSTLLTSTTTHPFATLDVLYDSFVTTLRSLSVSRFALFTRCPPPLRQQQQQQQQHQDDPSLPPPTAGHASYNTLLRLVLDELMAPPRPAAAAALAIARKRRPAGSSGPRPDPRDVDREVDDVNGFSLAMLERCFLPFAAERAGMVAENAKAATVMADMLWYLFEHGGVRYSDGLRQAVEEGIRSRRAKAPVKKKQRRQQQQTKKRGGRWGGGGSRSSGRGMRTKGGGGDDDDEGENVKDGDVHAARDWAARAALDEATLRLSMLVDVAQLQTGDV